MSDELAETKALCARLEQERDALKAAFDYADEAIHGEFCSSDKHHAVCLEHQRLARLLPPEEP